MQDSLAFFATEFVERLPMISSRERDRMSQRRGLASITAPSAPISTIPTRRRFVNHAETFLALPERLLHGLSRRNVGRNHSRTPDATAGIEDREPGTDIGVMRAVFVLHLEFQGDRSAFADHLAIQRRRLCREILRRNIEYRLANTESHDVPTGAGKPRWRIRSVLCKSLTATAESIELMTATNRSSLSRKAISARLRSDTS